MPTEHRYPDWRDLIADAGRIGLDALVIALPDRLHVEAALAAVETGLPILLEKPAATTAEDLESLAAAARDHKARIWISHVMRYQSFWLAIRGVVESGAIGRLVTMRVEENIGFWHFAHSYVRGNWRNLATSSPMVLAKTCHDLDIIRWFAGRVARLGRQRGLAPVLPARARARGRAGVLPRRVPGGGLVPVLCARAITLRPLRVETAGRWRCSATTRARRAGWRRCGAGRTGGACSTRTTTWWTTSRPWSHFPAA